MTVNAALERKITLEMYEFLTFLAYEVCPKSNENDLK